MPGSALLRRINQARVLRLLKEQASLSRAEIARYLELTRSTVTLVTAGLLTDRLIVPTGNYLLPKTPADQGSV
jgi:DNA-binding IclR family transcriptional regulator